MQPADRSAGRVPSVSDDPPHATTSAAAPAGAETSGGPLPGDRVRDSRGVQASVVQPTISLDTESGSGVWLRVDQPEAGRWVRLPLDLLVRSADGQYWCMAAFDTLIDAGRPSPGEGMFPDPEGTRGAPVPAEPGMLRAADATQVSDEAPVIEEMQVAQETRVAEETQVAVGAQLAGPVQAADERLVIPVIEESLQVDRRTVVRGGLRLDKTVQTRREVVDEPLMRDELSVERVPINTLVSPDALPLVRHEGDTMIVPVFEEVLVVERRMLLKEEIRIHRIRKEFHAPQAIELRREHVSVRRIDGDGEIETPPIDPAAGSQEPVPMSDKPQAKTAEES